MLLLLYGDGVDPRGTQCPLNKKRGVIGEVNHIDIFVAQLPYDTMNAETLHAHTGTYRVDTVVISFHGHFGAFAGNAGYPFNGDESVGNLRNLLFEQPLQKYR